MRKTIRQLLVEYGAVAVVVYFAIFFLVIFAFAGAIEAGWQPANAVASAGTWVAAYLLTKLTQPLRIAATVALTPFVAKWYERSIARLMARTRR